MIADARCGLRAPSGEANALAEIMTDFIEHPERYRQCGENGRRYFEENFSLDIFVTALEKRLEALCQKEG